jgi:hypothetical protein
MEDLLDMMEEPSIDAEEHESEYDLLIDDDFVEEASGMSIQQFGMALGFAEMMSIDNESISDPAEVMADYQESLERISLQDRHRKSDVPVPAFEQYVYKKCGF